jgi:leucyl-tRNA synthetase
MTAPAYDPHRIEPRRQRRWKERDLFKARPSPAAADNAYVFAAVPFTSGDIHMGHVRSYAIADAYARFRRARGDAVLFSIGFDSFGLPAELGAAAHGCDVTSWVERCRGRMTRQLERLGFSFDWSRQFTTSEPVTYRWSQSLFLRLLEAGLIYRGSGRVDWCGRCATVLASIQVIDGRCWRCDTPVELVEREQWYLRIAPYVEENQARLADTCAEAPAWRRIQESVLGRTLGFELDARASTGARLALFCEHGAAAGRAAFVAVSPRHPELASLVSAEEQRAVLAELRTAERDRAVASAPVAESRTTVRVPGIARPLPLVVTPLVDARFGETAILGIPAADRTDRALAERLGIAFAPDDDRASDGPAPGLRSAVRYRARDFIVSRQRAWGTPIPVVWCERCGMVPVPERDLPVLLPEHDPALAPAAGADCGADAAARWSATTCPRCRGEARRELDTLDCHFDGLWMWMPICVPAADRDGALFEHPELRSWLPGRQLIWGFDGGGYILDQRMTAKALRDLGPLDFLGRGEPFEAALIHEMVHADGRKMSKHLGNVVDPERLVAEVGADAVRLAMLAAGAPRSPLNWSEDLMAQSAEFVRRLWSYAHPRLAEQPARPASSGAADKRRLERWCEAAARRVTEDLAALRMHRAAGNAMDLLARIESFERHARRRTGDLAAEETAMVRDALELLLRLCAPLIPHVCEELWEVAGHDRLLSEEPWPLAAAAPHGPPPPAPDALTLASAPPA